MEGFIRAGYQHLAIAPQQGKPMAATHLSKVNPAKFEPCKEHHRAFRQRTMGDAPHGLHCRFGTIRPGPSFYFVIRQHLNETEKMVIVYAPLSMRVRQLADEEIFGPRIMGFDPPEMSEAKRAAAWGDSQQGVRSSQAPRPNGNDPDQFS